MLPITLLSVTLANTSNQNEVLAYVKMELGGMFAVADVRVMRGKSGPFVAYPRNYNETEGKGYSVFSPTNKDFAQRLSTEILTEYRALAEAKVAKFNAAVGA